MSGFNITGSKQRGGGMMMSILKRFFWGLSAAVLTYVVVPKMRHMAKPVVRKGVSGVKNLAERGKQTMEEFKARREDNTVDMVHDTTLEQVQVDSDVISGKINALQETIDRLKNEINQLRERR
jgi:polyhydroxyalkanoate synthesis regulator phasin